MEFIGQVVHRAIVVWSLSGKLCTVQSSCGVYWASCVPSCIEIKVRSVWHAFRNVTCSCVRFVCVSSVAESVLRVLLAATLVQNTARETTSRLCVIVWLGSILVWIHLAGH